MTQAVNPEEKRNYKATLNLPQTSFAMKANLVQREPGFQERWAKMELYARLRKAAAGRPAYVLHDGPPYANGSIHLGHLLNKVLKDLVVRSRVMLGYDAPFVPGWDCHGLPIEHKVMKELGDAGGKKLEAWEIRRKCQKDADKFVNLQRKQMQRLGTLGDYENPYLTMLPQYEASTLEVFAEMVGRGLVYRALKPVHWSVANQTALAEAELEYQDREDTSIYVLFALTSASIAKLPPSLGNDGAAGGRVDVMIWTTTPWTLPANLAVALAPQASYGLYDYVKDGKAGRVVLAEALAEAVLAKCGAVQVKQLGVCKGRELEAAGLEYAHPFVADDRKRPIVTAEYVTLEDGTGMVHTAPGHGVEDYQTGLRVGLEIYCPVQADGTFDGTAPDWLRGQVIWDGNEKVVGKLKETGRLMLAHKFMHSYPHDWRSKTPVIFRATEQWFVSVNKAAADGGASLQELALQETADKVRFVPEWGRNRMRGMLESRPDWCLSRQRAWGLPIPAFYGEGGVVLLTKASVTATAAVIRAKGSDFWFKAGAAELLEGYDPAKDGDAPESLRKAGIAGLAGLSKGNDIFDVWFESGSSWNAVVRARGMRYPADLYLEGSDQHRGWFQLSLLPALAVTGQAPFKTVLTHGFMVDKDGHKMSKSTGNALEVEELLKEHGADVCRWWVCSLNTDNDIKVDKEFFRLAGEEYRKVRNTLRFLLSNLNEYDADRDRRPLGSADKHSVDAWVMGELAELVRTVRGAYESLSFRDAHGAIFRFCNETLSAVYLAAVKDRMYCDRADSDRRRRARTVMHDIADALIRLVAPVLPHTADEAYLALTGRPMEDAEACVHLKLLPEAAADANDAGWDRVMELRGRVLKALEVAKAEQGIENPLDAGVAAGVKAEELAALSPYMVDMADLCGISRFSLGAGDSIQVQDLRQAPRCERSWKRDATVKARGDGGMLSDRDAAAVGV